MTDISFITDTISIYRKNRYLKRRYDTIPIISVSPILSTISILSTHRHVARRCGDKKLPLHRRTLRRRWLRIETLGRRQQFLGVSVFLSRRIHVKERGTTTAVPSTRRSTIATVFLCYETAPHLEGDRSHAVQLESRKITL